MSDIEDIMSQVVSIGNVPTQREIELGEAVKRHVANRPKLEPITEDQRAQLVRALLDARNAIDAALAYFRPTPNS